jgi:hypothetical protein
MAGCFGNDPIDRWLESQVNAHCDDSGELSDQYLEDLDYYLNSAGTQRTHVSADVCAKLDSHEAIVHEGKVGILIDGNIKFFTAIDFEEITERLSQ